MATHWHRFADVKGQSLSQLPILIGAMARKRLSELRVFDLILDGDTLIDRPKGLYIIFTAAGECLYVGKCSTSQFVERIPGHFANSGSWMNQFLQYHYEFGKRFTNWQSALMDAGKCEILLLLNEKSDPTAKFENILRSVLKPKYNLLEKLPKYALSYFSA